MRGGNEEKGAKRANLPKLLMKAGRRNIFLAKSIR